MKLLIINGPNLNMLGIREKHLYGARDYAALCEYVKEQGRRLGVEVELFQSNHEGALVDCVHAHQRRAAGRAEGRGHSRLRGASDGRERARGISEDFLCAAGL